MGCQASAATPCCPSCGFSNDDGQHDALSWASMRGRQEGRDAHSAALRVSHEFAQWRAASGTTPTDLDSALQVVARHPSGAVSNVMPTGAVTGSQGILGYQRLLGAPPTLGSQRITGEIFAEVSRTVETAPKGRLYVFGEGEEFRYPDTTYATRLGGGTCCCIIRRFRIKTTTEGGNPIEGGPSRGQVGGMIRIIVDFEWVAAPVFRPCVMIIKEIANTKLRNPEAPNDPSKAIPPNREIDLTPYTIDLNKEFKEKMSVTACVLKKDQAKGFDIPSIPAPGARILNGVIQVIGGCLGTKTVSTVNWSQDIDTRRRRDPVIFDPPPPPPGQGEAGYTDVPVKPW